MTAKKKKVLFSSSFLSGIALLVLALSYQNFVDILNPARDPGISEVNLVQPLNPGECKFQCDRQKNLDLRSCSTVSNLVAKTQCRAYALQEVLYCREACQMDGAVTVVVNQAGGS